MVQITKEEAEYIRSKMPNAHISKTLKQRSSKGKYYVEETQAVLDIISQYNDKLNIVCKYPNSK